MRTFSEKLILFICFLMGIAFVTFVQLPDTSMLWREVQNTGHTVIFAFLSIITLLFIKKSGFMIDLKHAYQYVAAFSITLFAGITVELIQLVIHRDADIVDVLRDFIGIVSFLGIYAVVDPDLRNYWVLKGKVLKRGILMVGVFIMLSGLIPLSNLMIAYIYRNESFPVLIDFNKRWTNTFISTSHAQLDILAESNNPGIFNNKQFARLRLEQSKYPGLTMLEPVSDWSGFSYLNFSIYSEEMASFDLIVRVHDKYHNQTYNDRFNKRLRINHGINNIKIPLVSIRFAPKDRQIDMSEISSMTIFAVNLNAPIIFYISNISLK
jgi:VanZ family protein